MKYAHIHDTKKGQILITKEYDSEQEVYEITIWFNIGETALGKAEVKVENKSKADYFFQSLQDFEIVKNNLNTILNQDYL